MEKIEYEGKLIGLLFTTSSVPDGSVPHTGEGEQEEALGLLSLKHKKGVTLRRHMHKGVERVTSRLQECFVVLEGKVEIKLYSDTKKYIKSIVLEEKEAFLAMSGGHEFEILEDCVMLELKNGPYKEDKIFF